jgi:hypothetical protein
MATVTDIGRRLHRLECRLPKRRDPDARPAIEVVRERMQEISARLSAPGYVPEPEPTPEELAAERDRMTPAKREFFDRLAKVAGHIAFVAKGL